LEKRQPDLPRVLDKFDICMKKRKTKSLYLTLHKNRLKWIKDLKEIPLILKLPQKKIGRNNSR
jgi:hypothetical protein